MLRWAIIILLALGPALPIQAGSDEEEKNDEEVIEENGRGRGRGRGWGRGRRQRRGRGRRGQGRGQGRRHRHRHGHGRGHGRYFHHRDTPELSPVQMVQELLNEDRIDEAEKLLSGLEGDRATLESLRGILAMKRKRFDRAAAHFRQVLALKPQQTAVWLYLGQACFMLKKYDESLGALIRGEKIGRDLPSYFQLRARVERELGRTEDAYRTLDRALGLFPTHHQLIREQALLLVNEELYAAALEKGQEYLSRNPRDRDGYLILGEALRSAGQPHRAAVILEEAALRFEQDPQVLARLAFAHATDGHNLAAARLFARATRLGGDHAFPAAEHYRLAGQFRQAMEQNALVPDPEKRLSQRLALYLGGEHFDRAAALERLLSAAGALDDTNRYRLAYALLRTGDLDRAEKLCLQIGDPALEQSATKLLQAIARERTRGPPAVHSE
jgi:tetratricopeptide (TPR) repeat protein